MKTLFIILSLAFLGLWVIGLCVTTMGIGIHMTTLMLSLVFFLRSLMIAPLTKSADISITEKL